MFLHVKQSDCKAAVKVVSGIWLKVCAPSFFLQIVDIVKKIMLLSQRD